MMMMAFNGEVMVGKAAVAANRGRASPPPAKRRKEGSAGARTTSGFHYNCLAFSMMIASEQIDEEPHSRG